MLKSSCKNIATSLCWKVHLLFSSFMNCFWLPLSPSRFSPLFINKVASSTFGIYLIHEHQLMAVWLFPVLLKNVELYQTKWFIPSAIASVVVVFIVCSIIDLLRQKLLSGVKEKVISWIDSRYSLINH